MKCKYCQAELEEGVTLCHACGKETIIEEKKEDTAYCISKIGEEHNTNGDFHIPSNSFGKCDPLEEFVSGAHSTEESVKEDEGNTVVETKETLATETAEPAAAEIKEGIKATPGKITLAIVAGVVVLALLVAMVLSGIDGDLFKKDTGLPANTEATVAVESATEGTIPPDGNPDDVTCKGSYSVTDEELAASVDTVVATLGDAELTVGQLQIYYWESIYAFDSEWGSYAAQMGLNVAGNMDRQLCEVGDVSLTWQQYFLDYALNTWHTHQAVALAAKEAGYELEEVYKTELDGMRAQLEESAKLYGMANADELITSFYGPGCGIDAYQHYLETYYRGFGYLENLSQNLSFTAEEVEAFYTENEELYGQNGLTKDAGKYYHVRHILLKPSENAETGADGYPVYTEEQWLACEAEAQRLLDAWKANDATEDSFAALAVEKSEDPGSKDNGGLYENLTAETNFVPTFKEWYLDETRQVGDTGLVKSQHGYHIMYFVGTDEIWYATAEADLLSQTVNAKLPAAKEAYPIAIDYSAIKLGVMPQGE